MISVIICTYNRSESLKRTLKSLEEMVVPDSVSWEIVIVDNNSSDDTKGVVEEFTKTSDLNVRYVLERRKGLGCARNTSLKIVSGDIIAFTDDDCIADRHWLASILREFQLDPSLSGVGGRVELYN